MNPGRSDLAAAINVLAAQGWFSQRSEETRARLSAIAKLRNFAKDELVYLAGDPPNGVFGLVAGSLNVSFPRGDGEDYTLHRAGSGFWVGDLALFSSGVRLVSVRAAEPSLMVHLPVHDLETLVRDDPRIYADFYALTYENFKIAFRIISNLGISSTEKRLAEDGDGWIPLSQAELAKLVAISVPTLQRVMRRFAGAGLVKSSYARIQVTDRDALRRLCRG
jgi:CRP-like cAMP-binding protein